MLKTKKSSVLHDFPLDLVRKIFDLVCDQCVYLKHVNFVTPYTGKSENIRLGGTSTARGSKWDIVPF